MIPRTLFNADHEAFRSSFRRFMDKEIAPFHEAWEEQGYVDREVWRKAGQNGFLCMTMPEAYGGSDADKLYSVVQMEELSRAGFTGIGYGLHNEIVAPYLLHYGTDAQKAKYLPLLAGGEMVGAIAMSEPAAGSDLQGLKTTALKQADGSYLLNGSKTFITNGWHADLVIVVAKTDPDAGHAGISLLVVDSSSEGFSSGGQIGKLGQHASDTTELFFDDVKVPVENLLGAEGSGFIQLMEKLVPERLIIGVGALSAAEAAFEITLEYVKERTAFGRPIGSFQNSRFVMAEIKTELAIGRAFIDQCIVKHCAGELTIEEAAMSKWWTTELLGRVTDSCLQLHGGYG